MITLLFFIAIPVGLIAIGAAYQAIGTARDNRRFPAKGRLIQVGKFKLHLWEQGSGGPTVVLEAGIAGTCLGWAIVQPQLAAQTTVLSYDRAGLGWSDGRQTVRSLEQMTGELAELLCNSGHAGPYIFVGHSFGGLLVRAVATRYPELAGALVLVDPVSVTGWSESSKRDMYRLQRGIALSRRGALLARLGVVRLTLNLLVSGSRLIPQWIGRKAAGNGTATMERLIGQVQRLPRELRPIVQSHWSDSKCFFSMAAHLECLPKCALEASAMQVPPHIPQIILSATTATTPELLERDKWVAGSPASKHLRIPNTGHWIQLEQPHAVVQAIQDAIDLVVSQNREIN